MPRSRFAPASLALAAVAGLGWTTTAALGGTPAVTTNFTGGFLGSTGSGFAFTPPDTNGAVGPGHFVELLNGIYTIYNKNGGAIVGTRSTDTQFWIDAFNNAGAPFNPGIDLTDPRTLYDPLSHHFFAVEVTLAHPYQVMVARSNTSNPADGWKAARFASPTNVFPDYPSIGVDANGVYIGANTFPDAGGSSVSLWSLPKADLLLSTPSVTNRAAFTQRAIGTYGWTLQPIVDNAPVKTSEPVLATLNGNPSGATTIKRSTIFNGAGVATLSASATSITVNSYSVPPAAVQPPGSPTATFDTIDGRFQSTVYQVGNSIWATHCISIAGRAGIRWYQLDATTNAVLQQGQVSDPSFDYHQPSIAANAAGDVVIGFTRSGASTSGGFAGAYAVVGSTSGGTTTFGSPITLHGGEQRYSADGAGEQRWGDYSETNPDPADPGIFWTIQEYSKAGNVSFPSQWGTNISEITIQNADEFRWKDPVNGDFSTGTLWLPGSAPTLTSHAIFSRPTTGTAGYTVTISSNQTNDRLSVRQGDVALVTNPGVTYSLANASIATPSVMVGEFEGTPNLTLRGSGTVSSVNATIAPGATSNTSVTLSESATWNNSGAFYVAGNNTTSGGVATVTVNGNSSLIVGGTLRVWNQGKVLITSGGNKVLRAGDVVITPTSLIDLSDNDMIVDYSGASPAATILGYLNDGRNGGAWHNTHGITSSATTATTSLGYGENSDLNKATFDGIPVDATSFLIKFTYLGDSNLDGQVDVTDLGALATNWQTSGGWTKGDFNYDNFVDVTDLGALATNWQQGVGSPLALSRLEEALQAVGLGNVSVPEPGLFSITALLGMVHTIRRSRRRRAM